MVNAREHPRSCSRLVGLDPSNNRQFPPVTPKFPTGLARFCCPRTTTGLARFCYPPPLKMPLTASQACSLSRSLRPRPAPFQPAFRPCFQSQVKLLASPFKMAAAARRLLLDGCCSALFEESSSRTSGVCALHIEQRRRERRPVSWAPTSIGANVLAAHERRHVRDSTAVRFHSDRRHRRCPLSVRHLP